MNASLLIMLASFLSIDAFVLSRQDDRLFKRTFVFFGAFLFVLAGFILFLFFLKEGFESSCSLLVLAAFFLYLKQRVQFQVRFRQLLRSEQKKDDLALAADATGNLLFWFLGMGGVAVFFSIAKKIFPALDSRLGQTVFMTACSSFLMFFLIYWTTKKRGLSLKGMLALSVGEHSWVRVFVFPAFAAFCIALFSSSVIALRQHQPQTAFSELVGSNTSLGVFMALFLTAVLIAPFFEEIIYRGYFFTVIDKYFGKRSAIFLISMSFAAMHYSQYWGDWAAILIVTGIGFFLTALRAYTQTSIASIIAHYVYNGSMTVIPVILILLSNPSYTQYVLNYPQLTFLEKEELLLKSIERDPKHVESYNALAWMYAEEGRNLNEALWLIEKALAVVPGDVACLDTKAEILFQSGRIEEAIEIEDALVERGHDDKYTLDQLKKFQAKGGSIRSQP